MHDSMKQLSLLSAALTLAACGQAPLPEPITQADAVSASPAAAASLSSDGAAS